MAVRRLISSCDTATAVRGAVQIANVRAACASNRGLVAATGSGSSCGRSLAILGLRPNICWTGLNPLFLIISFLLLQVATMHCSNSSCDVGFTGSNTFWKITSKKWPCFSTLLNWLWASAAVLRTLVLVSSSGSTKDAAKLVRAGSKITSTGAPAHDCHPRWNKDFSTSAASTSKNGNMSWNPGA